jgi:hypothetical protein
MTILLISCWGVVPSSSSSYPYLALLDDALGDRQSDAADHAGGGAQRHQSASAGSHRCQEWGPHVGVESREARDLLGSNWDCKP